MKPPLSVKPRRDILSRLGCIGYWPINEGSGYKVFDLSGGRNNGIEQVDSVWQPGKYGTSRYFSGNDYIRVPSHDSLHFADGESFTIIVGFYPSGSGAESGERLINDRGTGAAGLFPGYQMKITTDTGEGVSAGYWAFDDTIISDGGLTGKVIKFGITGNGSEYPTNKWYEVALRYRSDNDLTTFVNGIQDASISVGAYGSLANSLPIAIGASIAADGVEGYYTQFLVGKISHIIVHNRALAASEIARLYIKPFCMYERRSRPMSSAPAVVVAAGARRGIGFRKIYGADRLRGLRSNALY